MIQSYNGNSITATLYRKNIATFKNFRGHMRLCQPGTKSNDTNFMSTDTDLFNTAVF